jgi:ABC-type sugar transport system substrate-binding protein
MNKSLLTVSAVIEAGAGAALIAAPVTLVAILVGGTLDSPGALAVARLAGAALLTIGFICWFASRDSGIRAATGVVAALVFYNAAAVGVLLYARVGMDLSGPGTLPAIVLHAGLAAWCLACVRRPAA